MHQHRNLLLAVGAALLLSAGQVKPETFRAEDQLLAGDIGFSTSSMSTFASDRLSVTVEDICVKNYRLTTATDVIVELWLSKQIPTITGDTTHQTFATGYIGTIQPGVQRCIPNGPLPGNPISPDLYWFSLALIEGTGPLRVLHAIITAPNQIEFRGPIFASGERLLLETPITHYFTNGGNTASLQVARIRNSRSATTRQLRIGLRATTDAPRYGPTISGWTIASKEYAPLPAGYSHNDVDTGSLAVSQPPVGTYWISAMLWELGTDGEWYWTCFYTFPNQYTFTGAAPAPAADFNYAPTSPQVGQVVAFSDTSTGTPTSWSWNFGDGGTSTAQNPSHVFATSGSFSVSLTVANGSGSSTKTKTVVVSAAPSAPVITYFAANPAAVSSGQQTTLTWTSTGGTSASIDQGVGAVATSGSKSITPVIGVPYKLTVTGPGGSTSATVTISAVQSTYAGAWILPSSARVGGVNAFWTTDLTVMNGSYSSASVSIKFLGHEGNGGNAPERTYSIGPKGTATWTDVLSQMFGRESDYGPILIRSNSTAIVAQGQTWTASPSGGTYGQSVPTISAAESVGASSRIMAGVRQDSSFRTNIFLANMKESEASVTLQVLLPDGTTATTHTTTVAPLGFVQLSLSGNLGVTNIVGGSVVVSSSTAGAQIAAYASVIDSATSVPRTILAR